MCLIYFCFCSPEHGAWHGVGADSACVWGESRGQRREGERSGEHCRWEQGLGGRAGAGRSLEPGWEQGLGGLAGAGRSLELGWEQGLGGQGRGREEPGAGFDPPGAWFLRAGGPQPVCCPPPPADLPASSPCRKRPLGPGEPAHVPACGAGARPRPAEPGGGRVGQLWAPGHRPGRHQLADSGTGPALRLVAPGAVSQRPLC